VATTASDPEADASLYSSPHRHKRGLLKPAFGGLLALE